MAAMRAGLVGCAKEEQRGYGKYSPVYAQLLVKEC